jgi:hypothetical protein
MAKGKQVDSKTAEKLTRNEDKLIKIKEASSKFINDLCLLMEEITERSWRDLHPMLVKCSQFETQVSGDEAKAFVSMYEVITALKKIASEHGIKPEARLKDLQTVDPSVLSTRSKDDNRNSLAIENGFAGMALGGSTTGISISAGSSTGGGGSSVFGGGDDAMHFPPGSTHPQGLGGFPVRVAPTDDMSMNMMNINAAPAPTMDTMEQAFGSGASAAATRSAPNSGGMPMYNNGMDGHRNYSMDSLHGDFSAAPAPPPMGAPPPPPPAMGGSMNDGYNSFGGGGGGGGGQVPNQQPNLFGAPPAAPAPPPPMGYPQQQQQQQGGYHQQAGNFAQQQSQPMQGGNFAQQQQQPMYGGQPQQQQYNQQQHHQQQQQYNGRMSAPASYGASNNINTNPFG